ncbi:MAG: hypothetical protein ABIF92_00305 [archaeon]
MINRDHIEERLLSQYPGVISPVTPKDRHLYHAFFEQELPLYGNSWTYITQAANGVSEKGKSINKLGLKYHKKGESWNYLKHEEKNLEKRALDYYTQNSLLTIGYFERKGKGHFHIIRPLGKNSVAETENLAKILKEVSKNAVYVKKVTEEQKNKLLERGFQAIEKKPWDAEAIAEDDTWPEHIIDIKSILTYEDGKMQISQKKVRMGYNRFQNIKEKYKTDLKIVPYSIRHVDVARALINEHFKYFKEERKDICSTKEDYENLLLSLPLGKNNEDYFSFLVYVGENPMAFFHAEKIGKETIGTYANINLLRYPGLSEYLHVKLFEMAYKNGIRYVNLGGSELETLDFFKKKFSTHQNQMHWVVYK